MRAAVSTDVKLADKSLTIVAREDANYAVSVSKGDETKVKLKIRDVHQLYWHNHAL